VPEAFRQGNIEAIWDTPMYKAMQEADEHLSEVFPVFGSEKYHTSGLLGKMATSSF
jgi:hypothetical protein